MTQLSLSSLNDTVELQGTLERVVFHNEENGYTVFRVRPEGKDEVDLVTVVGHMGSPQAGASLRIKGRWVNNARFGRQVQMDSFESLLPATAEGIKLINEATPTDPVIKLKALEAFAAAANGRATKIIIPSEIQGLAGLAEGIVEAVKLPEKPAAKQDAN